MEEKARIERLKIELAHKTSAGLLELASNINMDADWIGMFSAKAALKSCIVMPIKFPKLLNHSKYKWYSSILLYGPPGWGKSMLIKSVANSLGIAVVNIDANILIKSNFNSKIIIQNIIEHNQTSQECAEELKLIFATANSKKQWLVLIQNWEAFNTEDGLKLIPDLLVEIQLWYMEDCRNWEE